MENFDYKLVMFGFSALCEDLEEVQRRLSLYPKERYELENGDECFFGKSQNQRNLSYHPRK